MSINFGKAMKPTAINLATFFHPTAICTRNPPAEGFDDYYDDDDDPSPEKRWPDSSLNPKNRINSLTLPPVQNWRIDGASVTGNRLFGVPNFAIGKAPLRIDIYIPDINKEPGYLRDTLGRNFSMFVGNSWIGETNMAKHILAALEHWSETFGWPYLESSYMSMPFGSRIMIQNIDKNIQYMDIQLVPYYAVEQQMLSVSALQGMWNLPADSWPSVMDLDRLQFLQQLHASISLVRFSRGSSSTYVFKSLTDDLKPLYHELKTLLTLSLSPNIICKPSYVITKKCRFGGKIGVCGFLLEYHPCGTLRTALSQRAAINIERKEKLRWARQITSALVHISETTKGSIYYTTLKPENIVLANSDAGNCRDAILIDFEQRLGPHCLNPPEVNYPAYLIDLAINSKVLSMKQKFTALLESANLFPTNANTSTTVRYWNPEHGPCDPWNTLTPPQREAAQVFALGKLLWCIFENGTLLNTAIGAHSFREETCDIQFPDFRQTPPGQLRELISKCTSGDGEWRGRGLPVVRRGNKIGVRGRENECEEDVQIASRKWWREEIADAEKFVKARVEGNGDDKEIWTWAAARPKLSLVLEILESLHMLW